MVGLTVYGCEEGKPHCREYIQIQLLESLVIGQEYSVSFWVGHLPRSLQVDNLGACFTVREVSSPNDEPLLFQPQVNAGGFLEPKQGSWVEVSGRFTATQEANYLIIGNFSLDSHTRIKAPFDDHFPFVYYYVDDVRVKKEEPILPLSLPDDDLSKVKLEAGQVFQLKNLFFETDEAELLPRSYTELNKLLQRMRERPEMVIQVIGHTDNRGEQDYNQGLSERRAKAVVDFLLINGISAGRVTYQGFGSSRPVAGNETEEGRQLNRRVEFVVVEM